MPTVELVNITSLCPPRPGTTIAYGISFPITAVQPVPLPQSPSMTFRQMVAGSAFSCVLMNSTTDGADFLFCFGDGGSIAGGVLHSNPPELFPVIVPLPAKPVREIGAGTSNVCVVFTDGTYTCFGPSNKYGEQGTGDTTGVGRGLLPETIAELQVGSSLSCLPESATVDFSLVPLLVQRPGNQTSIVVTHCRPALYSAVVSSIVPLNAPLGGNVLVSIRGAGLTAMASLSAPVVWIGSQLCLVRTVTSARIDCIAQASPTASYAQVNVIVGHPPAPDTPAFLFTYTSESPRITQALGLPPGGFNTSGGEFLMPLHYALHTTGPLTDTSHLQATLSASRVTTSAFSTQSLSTGIRLLYLFKWRLIAHLLGRSSLDAAVLYLCRHYHLHWSVWIAASIQGEPVSTLKLS